MADKPTPRYMAVDVECVAVGKTHAYDSFAPCYVAVVDSDENVLLKKVIKPSKPIVSYITPLTGFKAGDLDRGERLEDVIADVKALLGPDVVLVGQSVKSDIQWMQLEKGTDFADIVELGEMFKAYNARYGNYSFSTLQHEVNTLLEKDFISSQHDPATDAIASMKLFKKFQGKPALIAQAKKKLLSIRPPVSFKKRNNYRWEGVCMAGYYPAKCFCGAPTQKDN